MPFSARMSVRVKSTRVSEVHGTLTISPPTAVAAPETPAGKFAGSRFG